MRSETFQKPRSSEYRGIKVGYWNIFESDEMSGVNGLEYTVSIQYTWEALACATYSVCCNLWFSSKDGT